jgi:hypothetical protein
LQGRDHVVRPHIEELLRLLPHFRLGVFSSATTRTVNTALDRIYRRLKDIAWAKGLGGCRDRQAVYHCMLDPCMQLLLLQT